MVNTVKFSSLAQKELEESFDWYERRSVGLGERFAEIIYTAMTAIATDPTTYPNKRGRYREYLIDRFPYVIVYEYLEHEKVLNILHVFHTSRNPKLKYRQK